MKTLTAVLSLLAIFLVSAGWEVPVLADSGCAGESCWYCNGNLNGTMPCGHHLVCPRRPRAARPARPVDPAVLEERRRQAEWERNELARIQRAEEERNRKDAEQKQAAEEQRRERFLRERNEAAQTLKGTGNRTFEGGSLKETAAVDTGIKDLPMHDGSGGHAVTGPRVAWKHMHCSSSFARFGLDAARRGDGDESLFLMNQAVSVLTGGKTDLECPKAVPEPPSQRGGPDLNSIIEFYEKLAPRVLEQARVIRASRNTPDTQAATPSPIAPPLPTPVTPTDAQKKPTGIEDVREQQRQINERNAKPPADVIAKQKAIDAEMEKAMAALRAAQKRLDAEKAAAVKLEQMRAAVDEANRDMVRATDLLDLIQ